jgi:DNA excision repair protein ERCC-4
VGDLATLRRLLTYVVVIIIIVFIVHSVSDIYHVSCFVVCYPFCTATDLGSPSRYLLSYDALAFHAYLETLVASNTTTATGAAKQHQSPWMLTDAANVIFSTAKRRCYILTAPKPTVSVPERQVIDVDDEDAWAALDEVHGITASKSRDNGNEKEKQKPWVPDNMSPVLEELPKWDLLADVLQEIEEELMRQEAVSTRESHLLNNFLA